MKTRLEKHTVCASCLCVGIRDADCICMYQNDCPTITLEFEVCTCCGNLIDDGIPAETEFNELQFRKLNQK